MAIPGRAKNEIAGSARPEPTGGRDPAPDVPPGSATHPDGGTGARRGGVGYTTYAITVVVLLLVTAVVVFVFQNDARVSIWLFGSTRVMSVAGALAASAIMGLAVGLMIGLVPQVKLRRELRALRRTSRSQGKTAE